MRNNEPLFQYPDSSKKIGISVVQLRHGVQKVFKIEYIHRRLYQGRLQLQAGSIEQLTTLSRPPQRGM